VSRFDIVLQNTVSIENSSSLTFRNIDKVHESTQTFNFYPEITQSILMIFDGPTQKFNFNPDVTLSQ
jgi:hypothetical protein